MKKLCALLLLSNLITVHQVCAMSLSKETMPKEYSEGKAYIGTTKFELIHGCVNELKTLAVKIVCKENSNISTDQLKKFLEKKLYFPFGFAGKLYNIDQLTQALNKRLQERNIFIRLSDGKYYAFNIILAYHLGGQLPYARSVLEDIIYPTKKSLDAEKIQARFNPMTEEEYMELYKKKREELTVNQSDQITIRSTHKNSYHFDSPPSSYTGVVFGLKPTNE